MSKYKLTLNKNDNTSNSLEFEIPNEAGNYELWFEKDGFGSILVGDVTVDGKENIYNLKLGMSDGREVDAGTFTTPIIYCTLGITPNNSDYGSVSQSSIKVPYGSTISASGNKITINGVTITATEKTDTAQYDYTFSSWSNASGTVTGDRTITANFSRTVKKYPVTFTPNNSSYGSVSQTSITVPYGSTISVNGNKITINNVTVTATEATDTAQHDYAFSSWSNASGTVTGDRTITANFSRTVKNYTVTFTPNNSSYGSVSQTRLTVPYGTAWSTSGSTLTIYGTSITASPTSDTAQNDYSFSGWSPSSGTVTGPTTITASFARATQAYKLTISSKPTGVATHTVYRNGVALSNGATIYYGEALTQSATAASNYSAPTVNWSSITVTGNVTATATAGSYNPPSESYHTCDCCGYYGPESDFAYTDAWGAICNQCN